MKTKELSLEELLSVSVSLIPKQRAGKYWRPISHEEILQSLLPSIRREGIVLGDPLANVSKDKRDVEIIIPIKNVSNGDLERFLGIVNSNSGHKTLALFAGILHEGYPIPVVQVPYALRHRKSVDVPRTIHKMAKLWCDCDHQVGWLIRIMNTEPIEEIVEERLLITAGRYRLMPWSRIGLIDSIFRSLPIEQQNNWGLLFSFARIARMNPVTVRLEQVAKFKSILPTKAILPKRLEERFT